MNGPEFVYDMKQIRTVTDSPSDISLDSRHHSPTPPQRSYGHTSKQNQEHRHHSKKDLDLNNFIQKTEFAEYMNSLADSIAQRVVSDVEKSNNYDTSYVNVTPIKSIASTTNSYTQVPPEKLPDPNISITEQTPEPKEKKFVDEFRRLENYIVSSIPDGAKILRYFYQNVPYKPSPHTDNYPSNTATPIEVPIAKNNTPIQPNNGFPSNKSYDLNHFRETPQKYYDQTENFNENGAKSHSNRVSSVSFATTDKIIPNHHLQSSESDFSTDETYTSITNKRETIDLQEAKAEIERLRKQVKTLSSTLKEEQLENSKLRNKLKGSNEEIKTLRKKLTDKSQEVNEIYGTETPAYETEMNSYYPNVYEKLSLAKIDQMSLTKTRNILKYVTVALGKPTSQIHPSLMALKEKIKESKKLFVYYDFVRNLHFIIYGKEMPLNQKPDDDKLLKCLKTMLETVKHLKNQYHRARSASYR